MLISEACHAVLPSGIYTGKAKLEEYAGQSRCYRIEFGEKPARKAFHSLPGPGNTKRESIAYSCWRKGLNYKCQFWIDPKLMPSVPRPESCGESKFEKTKALEATFDDSRDLFGFLSFAAPEPVIKPLYDQLRATGVEPKEEIPGTVIVTNSKIAFGESTYTEEQRKAAGDKDAKGPYVIYSLYALITETGDFEGFPPSEE